MTDEELRERLTKIFGHYAVSFEVDGRYSEKPYVEQAIELFKQAGYVQLDDDQSYPIHYSEFYEYSQAYQWTTLSDCAFSFAQKKRDDMLKAGFKKVKKEGA